MPVLRYTLARAPQLDQPLLVFLPGREDHADVFWREGFVAAVRKAGLTADLIATDAHGGYYVQGSVVRLLHDEVIAPARKRGDRDIVLIGVSVGGYGAIRYAMRHPGEIATVVLLSPFLGAGPFMRELAEAGDEDFAQTWSWLKRYPRDASPKGRAAAGYPRLILGYGEEDYFLHSDHQLEALLPPHDVVKTTGAHLWSTWRALFQAILEKGLLAT